jgi:hypothetical protein
MHGSFRRLCRALTAVCVVSLGQPIAQGFGPAQQPATQAPKTDAATLPSARSIIDRHVEAVGGRKALAGHKSMKMQGTMNLPANGMSGKIELMAARPNKTVTRVSIPGVGDIEDGFDGTRGWSVNPMTGAMLTSGKELEERKFHSDFDSDLKEDANFEYMKTVEKTTFEGRPVYKIALKRKGATTEDIEYYDTENGFKLGSEATRTTSMGAMSVVSIASDYKKFGDLMHPTTIRQKTMGIEQVLTVSSIEYDVVPETAFEMPAAVKALIK